MEEGHMDGGGAYGMKEGHMGWRRGIWDGGGAYGMEEGHMDESGGVAVTYGIEEEQAGKCFFFCPSCLIIETICCGGHTMNYLVLA